MGERLLVAGDLHGRPDALRTMVEAARQARAKRILQLGDFGYFPRHPTGERFLRRADRLLERHDLKLWFLDGNHDDHRELWDGHPRVRCFARLARNVCYAPRGARWSWGSVRFLALGGAPSLLVERTDPGERRRSGLWFSQEMIRPQDLAAALRGGEPVDVLACHDAPAGVKVPGLRGTTPESPAAWNRQVLATVCEELQPMLVLHGHLHRRYRALLEQHGQPVQVEGLAGAWDPDRGVCALDLGALRRLRDERQRP